MLCNAVLMNMDPLLTSIKGPVKVNSNTNNTTPYLDASQYLTRIKIIIGIQTRTLDLKIRDLSLPPPYWVDIHCSCIGFVMLLFW